MACSTGGGKSILYQLPPLTKEYALSVVVTPLLALAMDQVLDCSLHLLMMLV